VTVKPTAELFEEIEKRLDIIDEFYSHSELSRTIITLLSQIQDIERIISRMSLGKIFPRDFLAISGSIRSASEIKKELSLTDNEWFRNLSESIPDLFCISDLIDATIRPDPALTPEQGRIVMDGVDPELDRLHSLRSDAKGWIVEYQEEIKLNLGIPTLKVRYNRILGYYIEVSKGQADKIPASYLRKQTLVGNERFTTEKLQKFETDVLSASEKIVEIEDGIIKKLLGEILEKKAEIQKCAESIGDLDFFISLARVAKDRKFTRPVLSENGTMAITDGRHPVVEAYYTKEIFIPNDILFDSEENMIKVITGPNMSGKSTYIRMSAMMQLMAQIGSFVPASSAEISIVDRIFTRIGASDNISRGESTFLVEMNETATILNNATDRSLIVMDEVGRGTSTYDGLSLAWAIVEYIMKFIRAKTLFATHYHELNEMENSFGRVKNFNITIKELDNKVIFLRKFVRGGSEHSFGIHVAKMAGMPPSVVNRANEILAELEKTHKTEVPVKSVADLGTNRSGYQLSFFQLDDPVLEQIKDEIKGIDINNLTPLDALNKLSEIRKLIGLKG